MRRAGCAVTLLVAAALLWLGMRVARPFDLGDPPDATTGTRLAGLRQDFARCRALLARAGVRFSVAPARDDGPRCGYRDGVRLAAGGSRRIAFAPAEPVLACPVAAALAMWEWDVVQPAALRRFGQPVAAIEQLGSYNCRHIAGRAAWSEHATADAIDVAAFRLADGRRVAVLEDWRGPGDAARFLHEVRAGTCPLFATVLSPDYNAAHRDHLHLDQAQRGGWGWRACR